MQVEPLILFYFRLETVKFLFLSPFVCFSVQPRLSFPLSCSVFVLSDVFCSGLICFFTSADGLSVAFQVRFGNALRGGGTNFTISDVQPDQITLDLAEGSTWRRASLTIYDILDFVTIVARADLRGETDNT